MYLVTESSQQTQYLGILILGTATPISQMRIRRLNDATKVTRKVGAEQESESLVADFEFVTPTQQCLYWLILDLFDLHS